MAGIKATNSKNIHVEDCSFYGFETDIELDNVEGFVSKNNKFSQQSDPRTLLAALSKAVENSGLDKSSKARLSKQIIQALSSKERLQNESSRIQNSLKYIGDKAVDLFVQLSAAVIAGLVIK